MTCNATLFKKIINLRRKKAVSEVQEVLKRTLSDDLN
jgi:hypothetical protein